MALKLQSRKVPSRKPQLICSYMQVLDPASYSEPPPHSSSFLILQLSLSGKDGERLQGGSPRSVPSTGKYCFSLEVAV